MNTRGLCFLAATTTTTSTSPYQTHLPISATAKSKPEVRVCTNRTCRRQGSTQTLQVLTGLSPPDVSVVSSGCLGRCGAGPNIVILPDAVFVGHCGTAAKAAEVMMSVCGISGVDDGGRSLEAYGLRMRGESEFGVGNLLQAEILLSQALKLEAFGGVHVTYKVRSTVRLASGNHLGALEDAREALRLDPLYVEAHICQGDALLAMDQFDAAEKSYATALEIDPTLRRSNSFKARITRLQEKVAAVST